MKHDKELKVFPNGDREVVMTRVFAVNAELLFNAWTKPDLIRRWLLGPPGWTMPVCEVDLRVGGAYRYVWRRDNGDEMGMGGVYVELDRPRRIVNTERFDDPWYKGEAVITTTFVEKDGHTLVSSAMLLDTREARDGILKSGMESGVAVSYDRLEELLRAPPSAP